MECPKCGGSSYLSEEELVKVLENREPVIVLLKSVYSCRACGERFSRLVFDELSNRRKPEERSSTFVSHQTQNEINPYQYQKKEEKSEEKIEGLRFF